MFHDVIFLKLSNNQNIKNILLPINILKNIWILAIRILIKPSTKPTKSGRKMYPSSTTSFKPINYPPAHRPSMLCPKPTSKIVGKSID